MGEIRIKCDQMPESWNYDTCIQCRRFTSHRGEKGTNWNCSLNNGSAAEKRSFYAVWAENYLIARGVMKEKSQSTIIVDYVGKKKRS